MPTQKFSSQQFPNIDLNPQFRQALELMEQDQTNVFVTGRAGTGKSTLLQLFRSITKKDIVVLASTGVAAVNVQGQTIHSFFRFKPDITPIKVRDITLSKKAKQNYQHLHTVVIDEISMVRADLFDCIDAFLRLYGPKKYQPFGGVQLIGIGDLYQLPPVVKSNERAMFQDHYKSPYFFDAMAFQELHPTMIELEKIYRQSDHHFITLLNAIRNKTAGEKELQLFNKQHDPQFVCPAHERYIYLTTTNAGAERINQVELQKSKGRVYRFAGVRQGSFDASHLPTAVELSLKKQAQVMMVNNDSAGRWINGTIGMIVDIDHDDEGKEVVIVALENGCQVQVHPYTWELYHFSLNTQTKQIESEVVGSFTQYPMMLAWAVTIHKSQGKTFDRVVLDLERGTFAHGQLYVALSRCRTLEGLVLKQPLKKFHIWMDWRVVQFMTDYQYQQSAAGCSTEEKKHLITAAIQQHADLTITYLKKQDEKSHRVITPQTIGEMEYARRTFLGLEAYCHTRKDTRIFRVDRILTLARVKK